MHAIGMAPAATGSPVTLSMRGVARGHHSCAVEEDAMSAAAEVLQRQLPEMEFYVSSYMS